MRFFQGLETERRHSCRRIEASAAGMPPLRFCASFAANQAFSFPTLGKPRHEGTDIFAASLHCRLFQRASALPFALLIALLLQGPAPFGRLGGRISATGKLAGKHRSLTVWIAGRVEERIVRRNGQPIQARGHRMGDMKRIFRSSCIRRPPVFQTSNLPCAIGLLAEPT